VKKESARAAVNYSADPIRLDQNQKHRVPVSTGQMAYFATAGNDRKSIA